MPRHTDRFRGVDLNFSHPLGSEVVAVAGPEPNSWSADLGAGYFIGELDVRLVGARRAVLLSDFTFVDSFGVRWEARRGDMLDGSSIPWYVQLIVGSPWVGLHRFASGPHDVFCVKKERPSAQVHRMYYDACRAAGEGRAWWLYAGIRLGGPRFLARTPFPNVV